MELSFRGAKYEHRPQNFEIVEGDIGGRYRGSMWRIHRYRHLSKADQGSQEMTYRGVHYKRG